MARQTSGSIDFFVFCFFFFCDHYHLNFSTNKRKQQSKSRLDATQTLLLRKAPNKDKMRELVRLTYPLRKNGDGNMVHRHA